MILTAGSDICQLYRMKVRGDQCSNPDCPSYNSLDENPSMSCTTCYGTGWVDGYDYVEEIYVRFPPAQEIIEFSEAGLMRMVKPRIWTMPDPELKQYDILINFNYPQVVQEKTEVDVSIYREVGTSFDSLNETINEYRQVVKIIKTADSRNSDADYKEGVDYILSNNGVLWVTDNKPVDDDEYFVTYKITHRYYRRYEINKVTPSRWRGKTLHQDLEITELPLSHPFYLITQIPLGTNELATAYTPFPTSDWYSRE